MPMISCWNLLPSKPGETEQQRCKHIINARELVVAGSDSFTWEGQCTYCGKKIRVTATGDYPKPGTFNAPGSRRPGQ